MATSPEGPVRLPLAVSIDQRGATSTTDSKLVNATAEKSRSGDVHVLKRPGFGSQSVDSGVSGIGLGCFYWYYSSSFRNLYTVTGTTLRQNQTSTIGTVDNTANAVYWFNTTLGTPSYMYMSNGYAGYTLTSAGVFAQIADSNYPARTVPGSAYLDGTLYVMDPQARIWGTAGLNNPTTWSALNLIQAQVEPDQGIAIAKQAIYVVAFKQWTTEFFYDAGSPTGSPLLPVQNAKLPFGCLDGRTVQSIDDVLYFVGVNKTLGTAVYRIRSLKIEQISDEGVDRYVEANAPFGSFQFHADGHTYYGVHFNDRSMVFDTTAGVWSIWNENTALVAGGAVINSNVDVISTTVDVTTRTQYLQSSFNGSLIRSAGRTNVADYSSYNASTQPIFVEIVTPPFDGNTARRKTLSKMRIVADSLSGGQLSVQWSDDDYKTYTPQRYVNLAEEYPPLMNLGTFRHRAFKFRHQSPTPMRIQFAELTLLLGSA